MKIKILTYAVLAVASAQSLLACDLCAVYSATESRGEIGRGFYAGVAEQFTHFGTWQMDGNEVPNTPGEFMDSFITQALVGYNVTDRVGLQLNVPIIHRSFRRAVGHDIERGHESGLGDVSLIGHVQLIRKETDDVTVAWNVLGGLKFPTGSSSRIQEEVAEHESEEEEGHHEHPSGVHGHDLTLGSGSIDGIIGTSVYVRWKRAFFSAATQYSIRTIGDYDYQFANDLIWSGGPGCIAVMKENFTLSVQLNCTGESKCEDEFMGEPEEGTSVTSVFLGPEILVTWRNQLSAELGADFPVSIDNTALQLVPDWRLRVALTWRF